MLFFKKIVIFSFLVLALSSCARSPDAQVDPYEGYNRVVFRINTFVDKVTLRPIAQLYSNVVPQPVQRGFSNVLSNIGEVNSMANDLLQLKLRYFFVNFWRFVVNTTVGVGGIFDVATKAGLPKHNQNFGLTLAYWSGGTQSPFFMLPLLGPSTLRGIVSWPAEIYLSPLDHIRSNTLLIVDVAGNIVTTRAKLLPTDALVEQAFDPYVFVRDAYMQRLRARIAENQQEAHS
jgi:phospholipid-binding lipoprotein MlaA